MEAPKVCILACEGSTSEVIVREALKELGSDVLLCTLNEATNVEDIRDIAKTVERMIIVDSCSDGCIKSALSHWGYPTMSILTLGTNSGPNCLLQEAFS